MRNAYVTKRICPPGYIAVTKPLARKLYDDNVIITICGNDVSNYNVFSGWHLGYTFNNVSQWGDAVGNKCAFDTALSEFIYHLDRELGQYAVFYIKKEDYERWLKK